MRKFHWVIINFPKHMVRKYIGVKYMDYHQKYLKYKHKYLQLKKLSGGSLEFVQQGNKYHMLKQAREDCNDDMCLVKTSCQNGECIVYEKMDSDATSFNEDEKLSIEDFANKLLPLLQLNGIPLHPQLKYTMQSLIVDDPILLPERFPKTVGTETDVIGAGQFGVTFGVNKMIVKIAKIYSVERLASEILINQQIPPHPNINKFYGWMTSNRELIEQLNAIPRNNLYNTSVRNGLTINGVIPPMHISDTLVMMLFDRADMGAVDYLIKVGTYEAYDKFIDDVILGIKHLHANNILNNDIKIDNVVANKKSPTFQIIDFGLSSVCLPNQVIYDGLGSPAFYRGSVFDNQLYNPPNFLEKSLYYDWHCLYITLLYIFDLVKIVKIGTSRTLQFDKILFQLIVNTYPRSANDMVDNKLFEIWLKEYLDVNLFQCQYHTKWLNIIIKLSHSQEMHLNHHAIIQGIHIHNYGEFSNLL